MPACRTGRELANNHFLVRKDLFMARFLYLSNYVH